MSQDRELLLDIKRLLEIAQRVEGDAGGLSPLGERLAAHLGADPALLPAVTESVAAHRVVDADVALEELTGDGEVLGVRGPNREHDPLTAMIARSWAPYDVGPVDYALVPSGPRARRRVVAFGLRLLRFEERPVVVLQRAAARQFGREHASLEVLTDDSARAERLLAEVRRLMHERSVLRGQVLSFSGGGDYGEQGASMFLEREAIPEDDVVLGAGVLPAIRRHVLGIAEHRDVLRAAGRHLKRGVLLYGPPGTGKTLTVRHLVGAAEGTTVVLLTGPAIRFISEATDLARGLQPALVVLEDIDLVAMDRGRFGPQPLLFAVLDALDGLDGDADVTFLMTTNRVEMLERALAQRPGRVDLAVEVPRPDAVARRRLFGLYARGLPLSDEAVTAAATRAEGTTASFAKELMRRVVLTAAIEGRPVVDGDLRAALDEMLAAGAALTRSLLGMAREGGEPAGPDDEGDLDDDDDDGDVHIVASGGFGWTAYSPLSSGAYTPPTPDGPGPFASQPDPDDED